MAYMTQFFLHHEDRVEFDLVSSVHIFPGIPFLFELFFLNKKTFELHFKSRQ